MRFFEYFIGNHSNAYSNGSFEHNYTVHHKPQCTYSKCIQIALKSWMLGASRKGADYLPPLSSVPLFKNIVLPLVFAWYLLMFPNAYLRTANVDSNRNLWKKYWWPGYGTNVAVEEAVKKLPWSRHINCSYPYIKPFEAVRPGSYLHSSTCSCSTAREAEDPSLPFFGKP